MSVTLNLTPPSRTLLTEADVAGWREELEQLSEQITQLQGRAADLRRKLDAAALFMEAAPAPMVVLPSQGTGKSATLVEAVKNAVAGAAKPLSPKEIRAAILASADASLITNENYLYTAIKRVADSKGIIKEGNGYVAAPPS